jgi:hypothetical protein
VPELTVFVAQRGGAFVIVERTLQITCQTASLLQATTKRDLSLLVSLIGSRLLTRDT